MRRIESLLAALESPRRRLLAEVEGLLEPRFSARPARGGWSAAMVFEHLSRVEGNVARGIEAGLAGKLKIERRWNDPLRRLIYLSGIYRVMAVKTVTALDPAAETAPVSPRPEAMARFAAAHDKLAAAIESADGPRLWKLKFRHPIFGPLSAAEMLDFVAEHEERHRLQIVRIKAALERAKPA